MVFHLICEQINFTVKNPRLITELPEVWKLSVHLWDIMKKKEIAQANHVSHLRENVGEVSFAFTLLCA